MDERQQNEPVKGIGSRKTNGKTAFSIKKASKGTNVTQFLANVFTLGMPFHHVTLFTLMHRKQYPAKNKLYFNPDLNFF